MNNENSGLFPREGTAFIGKVFGTAEISEVVCLTPMTIAIPEALTDSLCEGLGLTLIHSMVMQTANTKNKKWEVK